MIDPLLLHRLRRYQDDGFFLPELAARDVEPAAVVDAHLPLHRPDPSRPPTGTFAPIDRAIFEARLARYRDAAPFAAGAARPGRIVLLDIAALEPRLAPYRETPAFIDVDPYRRDIGPLDWSRTQAYRDFALTDSYPKYSQVTRDKIADVQAFDPPKSLWQEGVEAFLRAPKVSPAGWRLAEPLSAQNQTVVQQAGGVFPAIEPFAFLGPDGVAYRHNAFSREDPMSSRVRVSAYKRRQRAEQQSAPVSIWDLPPEVFLFLE